MTIETDYLVIGAGAMGLAFADELLTRTDAHITIVDKRAAPGGHWNDAYPFVRLHQPSVFYGVESKELAEYRIDTTGTNRGLLTLAEGCEVTSYFHSLMRERLLPSGRVEFLPMHEVAADGGVRSLLSREQVCVRVRKKIVDAGYLTNSIPKTHTRSFQVAAGVNIVPPNDLPLVAASFKHFCVLGAGKTGSDTCTWLLEHGAPADAIRWVVPRDAWLVNRAFAQPGPEFFTQVFGAFASAREALASASSSHDYALRMEACGVWLRLDRTIEPTMFHAASISEAELAQLQRIRDVVRMGRVRALENERLLLDGGELSAPRDTLFIDCTARALARPAAKPVFGERITLQMVRIPQLPFSAALCGFLEATFESDAEKNSFAAPIRIADTIDEYITQLVPETQNREACSRHPRVREWINSSRLEGFSRLMRNIDPDKDAEKVAVIKRLRESSRAASKNMERLLASISQS